MADKTADSAARGAEARPVDLSRLLDPLLKVRALSGAAAAVWQGGETILLEAVDLDDCTAMRPDSIFQIASMTKPIVAAAALQMIEEGTLTLDAPIATWLPEFA
jgi:CubicO group peptidase (beta-lactamase class C family)